MKTTILIKGTHCASCKALIEDVCRDTPGIQSCTVDYATGTTEIEHDENVNWTAFKQEVESLGQYSAEIPNQKTL